MKIFENFLKNFLQIAFFVQTRKNWTHALLNCVKTMLKLSIFSNLLKKIFKNVRKIFENFWNFFEYFWKCLPRKNSWLRPWLSVPCKKSTLKAKSKRTNLDYHRLVAMPGFFRLEVTPSQREGMSIHQAEIWEGIRENMAAIAKKFLYLPMFCVNILTSQSWKVEV